MDDEIIRRIQGFWEDCSAEGRVVARAAPLTERAPKLFCPRIRTPVAVEVTVQQTVG